MEEEGRLQTADGAGLPERGGSGQPAAALQQSRAARLWNPS